MNTAAAPKIEDSSVIVFEEGIIGVPRARRFQLLEHEDSPIRVLRCLDINGFALPVVDPALADPDYKPAVGRRVLEALGFEEDDPVLLLAVTTLEPTGPKANLRAPVVVNARGQTAAQVILEDRKYPLRAPVKMAEEQAG